MLSSMRCDLLGVEAPIYPNRDCMEYGCAVLKTEEEPQLLDMD